MVPRLVASHSLFIGGTASHVGKSWFATAFCRLLARRGYRVAPFKAQNMSNNSCPTVEGGEIGRSQAEQAAACGLPPMADMNPVLLKPCGDSRSQVVVNGKLWRTLAARDYYQHTPALFSQALASHARLAAHFDCLVCEGAGSVAEMNLLDRDIVNLRLAAHVGAQGLLVADIERGGVFGALAGTLEWLPPHLRTVVRAFAVNRFRGDPSLFDQGVTLLEQRLGIPCLGVFPFAPEIPLAPEDSLSLPAASTSGTVAALRLPQISNFTDFSRLSALDWVERPVDRQYAVVFLPGSKNTIADLAWLHQQGLAAWLARQHQGGARLVGICGGYQMLGESIADPEGLEGDTPFASGLGYLPVHTVLRQPKTTRPVQASLPGGESFAAYEIHLGVTQSLSPTTPFALLADGRPEGCVCGTVSGTYLHGAFENESVCQAFGLPFTPLNGNPYDQLADWLETHARPAVLAELLP